MFSVGCTPLLRRTLLLSVLASAPAVAQYYSQGTLIELQSPAWFVGPPALGLSADGNTAFVSWTCYSGCDLGTVYTFTRTNGVWAAGSSINVGILPHGGIGWALGTSEDGNTLIVGALHDLLRVPSGAGKAWMLSRRNGVWSREVAVAGGNTAVALSGDGNTAIVGGARFGIAFGTLENGTWVYTRTGGVWTLQGKLTSGTGLAALSRDGNTAIVGNLVYVRTGGVWTQQATLPSVGTAVGISADGNRVISGNVVFTRSAGVWTQEATLAGGENSVAISGDGNTVIMGGGQTFHYAGGVWTQGAGTLPTGSVAVSGDGSTVLAGAAGVWAFAQPEATSTTLVSVAGDRNSYTFTATVTRSNPLAGVPTGTVVFRDNGGAISGSSTTLNSSGAAVFTTTLIGGLHNISAAYTSSDSAVASSTSAPLTLSVPALPSATPPGATVNIDISSGAVTLGDTVTFVVSVDTRGGQSPAAGTVQFFDFATLLGTNSVTGGQTVFSTTLGVGSHSIMAVYSGDGTYPAASSSAYGLTVTRRAVSLSVASALPNTVFGQPVTFTATISAAKTTPAGIAPPSGNVQFYAGGLSGLFGMMVDRTLLGTAALTNGTASLTVSGLQAGSVQVVAVYPGDRNWSSATSNAVTQTVTLPRQ